VSVHASLLERHRKVMPDWIAMYYEQPIALARGEGRHVWDAEGTRYLDFFGGILTTSTAHALPEVVSAVQQQAERIMHSSTLYLIEPMIELAEEVAAASAIPDAKVFFTTSGTEANELALMLATTARQSSQVLAMRNSYHGRSFGAVAITGNRAWRPSQLSPLNVGWVEGGYPYRSPYGTLPPEEYSAACARDLERLLESFTAGQVAALIAEPIQGVGGFACPPDGFYGELKHVLDHEGVLLIADEVQTGWGRTGEHFWGWQAHGVMPDIVTFAKGVGNGLSIGGVIARAELMDCVPCGSISTFGGNPLSAAGSLANLRYIQAHDLQRNCAGRGTELLERLRAAQPGLPLLGDVRGKGLMIGLELVVPGSEAEGLAGTPDATAAAAVLEGCRERGLLVGKGGLGGNVLRIAPPMTLTTEEAAEGADVLLQVIGHVQQQLHGIAAPDAAFDGAPSAHASRA